MSEPVTESEPAAEQVPEVEVKQETSPASEDGAQQPMNGNSEATAMEVDSSKKESNLESANGAAKPFRRNGASRKRFKWLMDQGYSREAATQISQKPFEPKDMREKFIAETGFFKEKINQLNEDRWEDLDEAAKRRVKWLIKNGYGEKDALRLACDDPIDSSKRNLPSKQAAEAMELLVVAVAATDYPKTFLNNAQTDELKSAILKEVVQQKDSEMKPHFKNSDHIKGYLRVQCKDLETRRWLQRTVEKLDAPEGITLKVVTEKDVIEGDVYTGRFKDSSKDTSETILEFIDSQNEGIATSKWTVLNRTELPDTQTIELMFAVDEESAKSISNLNYELNYKFNTIRLRRKNSYNRPTVKVPKPPNKKRSFQQASSSFVPIWDSNFPKNRGGNNFNQSSGRGKPYNRGFNNRNMSNNNRGSFNLVDSLYDQLRLTSGLGSNFNQWGGNGGFNSNGPSRNYNGQGNRGFNPRSGFY